MKVTLMHSRNYDDNSNTCDNQTTTKQNTQMKQTGAMDGNANKDVSHFWKKYFSDLYSDHLVWLKIGAAVNKKRCKKYEKSTT